MKFHETKWSFQAPTFLEIHTLPIFQKEFAVESFERGLRARYVGEHWQFEKIFHFPTNEAKLQLSFYR
jgi:hypothetical protein